MRVSRCHGFTVTTRIRGNGWTVATMIRVSRCRSMFCWLVYDRRNRHGPLKVVSILGAPSSMASHRGRPPTHIQLDRARLKSSKLEPDLPKLVGHHRPNSVE